MKNIKKQIINKTILKAFKNVNSLKGGPFAAIITKGNKIIACSANHVTSKNDPTAHAEIETIRKACKKIRNYNLSGYELYTSCKPCPMCLSAIYWANIKKVYYCASSEDASKHGFKDSKIYKELSLPENQRTLKLINIKSEIALKPFKAWKNLADKKKY